MMRQIIEVADKAVSTDDLIPDDKEQLQKSILDVARLETVLAALVENKVVAIRTENEKNGSNHSSPIALLASRIHRRFQSNSTVSSEKASRHKLSIDNVRNAEEGRVLWDESKRGVRQRVEEAAGETTLQEESEKQKNISTTDFSRRRGKRNGEKRSEKYSERERDRSGDRRDRNEEREDRSRHKGRDRSRERGRDRSDDRGRDRSDDRGRDRSSDRGRDRSSDRSGERCWIEREPCLLPTSPEMLRHADMLEECSVVSLGGEECVVVLERERTRTRTRRKRRRRKHHRTIIVEAIDERVKVLDPDELPRRARWTIMVTACLLLFLCLMLVGVTLRMAPLIDDMVRQENERIMHESFNLAAINNTQPMAAQRKSSEVR